MSPEIERKKICVVDDEFEMRVFLVNLLNTGGFAPVVVESSNEGLQRVSEENPALIILNIMKYRDNSTLMYRDLKHDHRLKNIPVIMLSTLDRKTFFHYQKFKKTPVGRGLPQPEAYLNKPPEADELLHLVNTLTKSDRSLAVEKKI